MHLNLRRFAILLATVSPLLFAATSRANVDITLDLNSLPSAQGWTYHTESGTTEGSVFSVGGGLLHQNSFGAGDSWYSLDGLVDLALPFVLSLRVRLNGEEGGSAGNAFGFAAGLATGTEIDMFGLGLNRLQVDHDPNGQPVHTGLSTGPEFHDYRMEGGGGAPDFRVYVDGVLLDTGPNREFAYYNSLRFGDLTFGPNADVDIASLEFHQAVPEASTALLGVAGLMGLLLRRPRK